MHWHGKKIIKYYCIKTKPCYRMINVLFSLWNYETVLINFILTKSVYTKKHVCEDGSGSRMIKGQKDNLYL